MTRYVCACFFGFLRSGEITVPTLAGYEAGTHLSMADVTVDVPALPQVIRLNIKASKTDPFRQGVSVYLGRTGNTLCPLVAMLSYLAARGTEPGPLFRLKDGRPLLGSVKLCCRPEWMQKTIPGTASVLVPPPQQQRQVSKTLRFRPWGGGKAAPTFCM